MKSLILCWNEGDEGRKKRIQGRVQDVVGGVQRARFTRRGTRFTIGRTVDANEGRNGEERGVEKGIPPRHRERQSLSQRRRHGRGRASSRSITYLPPGHESGESRALLRVLRTLSENREKGGEGEVEEMRGGGGEEGGGRRRRREEGGWGEDKEKERKRERRRGGGGEGGQPTRQESWLDTERLSGPLVLKGPLSPSQQLHFLPHPVLSGPAGYNTTGIRLFPA